MNPLRRLARWAGLSGSDQGPSARRADPLSEAKRESTPDDRLLERVRPYSMTSEARLRSLLDAVDHVSKHGIPGDIVECGVWRGGSMMLAALRLLEKGPAVRHLWLYDTFEGMSAPGAEDEDFEGRSAASLLHASAGPRTQELYRCLAPIEDVERNIRSTGYPPELCHFVRGRVEETIPATAPESVAVLRLDTDWYASTKHELVHLYPRLVRGGVLILDDYGHWRGARKAVDEYLDEGGLPLFLQRVDYTGRCAVKP
jgi:O-methyltransferase